VIVHQRRHHHVRQAHAAAFAEIIEAIVGDGGAQRRLLAAPVRQQPVEPDRIDHRAGEDMGADFRALLHHDDREVGIDLLEADGGGEPGGPRADNHHIEFHCLAGRQFRHVLRS
jgi:hypothetical protein